MSALLPPTHPLSHLFPTPLSAFSLHIQPANYQTLTSYRRSEQFPISIVRRLDRVEELGSSDGLAESIGHTGCVNALSWSQDGRWLVSGSDDKRLCLWRLGEDYGLPPSSPHSSRRSSARRRRRPGSSMRMDDDEENEDDEAGARFGEDSWGSGTPRLAFGLSDVIETGHRANIFSAKWAPASDRRIFSCAGDRQVRVFDLSRATPGGTLRRSASGKEWTEWDEGSGACIRVLRCHSGRVKRISTENSPDVFLTCSEDGDVRQHDLRVPHVCTSFTNSTSVFSAPAFRSPPSIISPSSPTLISSTSGGSGGLSFNAPYHSQASGGAGGPIGCPPPLLRYPISLYSLSVSKLEPWLFCVAGTSEYAYLHDRRMIPRLMESEWGQPCNASQPTQCVRRFGLPPRSQNPRSPTSPVHGHGVSHERRSTRSGRSGGTGWSAVSEEEEEKHITAVKMSEANGKELLASYSGEAIYLFNIHDNPGVSHMAAPHLREPAVLSPSSRMSELRGGGGLGSGGRLAERRRRERERGRERDRRRHTHIMEDGDEGMLEEGRVLTARDAVLEGEREPDDREEQEENETEAVRPSRQPMSASTGLASQASSSRAVAGVGLGDEDPPRITLTDPQRAKKRVSYDDSAQNQSQGAAGQPRRRSWANLRVAEAPAPQSGTAPSTPTSNDWLSRSLPSSSASSPVEEREEQARLRHRVCRVLFPSATAFAETASTSTGGTNTSAEWSSAPSPLQRRSAMTSDASDAWDSEIADSGETGFRRGSRPRGRRNVLDLLERLRELDARTAAVEQPGEDVDVDVADRAPGESTSSASRNEERAGGETTTDPATTACFVLARLETANRGGTHLEPASGVCAVAHLILRDRSDPAHPGVVSSPALSALREALLELEGAGEARSKGEGEVDGRGEVEEVEEEAMTEARRVAKEVVKATWGDRYINAEGTQQLHLPNIGLDLGYGQQEFTRQFVLVRPGAPALDGEQEAEEENVDRSALNLSTERRPASSLGSHRKGSSVAGQRSAGADMEVDGEGEEGRSLGRSQGQGASSAAAAVHASGVLEEDSPSSSEQEEPMQSDSDDEEEDNGDEDATMMGSSSNDEDGHESPEGGSGSEDSPESEDVEGEEEGFPAGLLGSAAGNRPVEPDVPVVYPRRAFRGHVNVDTVKDVNFCGPYDQFVVSGSDDGNWFMWDKHTGKLEGIWEGDDSVVNVLQPHPLLPVMAISGIDNTIKVFAPVSDPLKKHFDKSHEMERILERSRTSLSRSARSPLISRAVLALFQRHMEPMDEAEDVGGPSRVVIRTRPAGEGGEEEEQEVCSVM